MTDAGGETIAEKAAEQGGTVYFVGGCVRDRLLGLENKDIDIEVHGIPPEHWNKATLRTGACMKTRKTSAFYS